MYMKNKRGPNTEACRTLESMISGMSADHLKQLFASASKDNSPTIWLGYVQYLKS